MQEQQQELNLGRILDVIINRWSLLRSKLETVSLQSENFDTEAYFQFDKNELISC